MNTDNTDSILDGIRQCLDSLAEVEVAWLYGSRARGDHHNASDYDIAVAFTPRVQGVTERRLRPELLAMDLREKLELSEDALSVVDINLAPIPLAFSIIEPQHILMEQSHFRRIQEEHRIMSRYEIDYLWHLQHHA